MIFTCFATYTFETYTVQYSGNYIAKPGKRNERKNAR